MDTLAQTACYRCRGQKLRCSRELPICARCKRLNAQCVFPDPSLRKSRRHARGPSRRGNEQANSISDDGSTSDPAARRPSHTWTQSSSSEDGINIPQDGQRLLIEVFFDSVFNASLLFHKVTFMHVFSEGTCPQHTLLSMFAMASIYLETRHVREKFDHARLQALGDAQALGVSCASRASEQVLRNIIPPTIDSARTCLMLGLYWFAKGDNVHNSMFHGIANRSARSLVQESKHTTPAKAWLHCEVERRVFWASWQACCVNSDHYIIGTSADSCILNMPLPASRFAFDKLEPEPQSCLADTSDISDVAAPRPAPWHRNACAEVHRLVLHWAKIHDHIESRKRIPAKQSLIQLLDLDHWLSNWMRTMSPQLAYSRQSLYQHTIVEHDPYFVLLHSMFHQCRMMLHATVVPQFAGLSASSEISPEAVRISAETALNNANAVASLAVDLLELNLDPTRFAPVVGHSMYVAATIHITFISSSNIALASNARQGLVATLGVLKSLKPHWAMLQKLWSRVLLLYEAQLSRMPAPKSRVDIFSCSSADEHNREIDRIINRYRNVGRLTEPLSSSVLRYGSGELKEDVEIDEAIAMQDLDSRGPNSYSSDVSPMVEGQPAYDKPDLTTYSSMSADYSTYDPTTLTAPAYDQLEPMPGTTYDPQIIDGIDWSHFDLDSLLLSIGPLTDTSSIPSELMPS